MKRPKLTQAQIRTLLLLWHRCRLTGRMTFNEQLRAIAVPLWRRELVEIWWRQVSGEGQRGPYFSLTAAGYQLACALIAARDERRRLRERAPVQPQPPSALAA